MYLYTAHLNKKSQFIIGADSIWHDSCYSFSYSTAQLSNNYYLSHITSCHFGNTMKICLLLAKYNDTRLEAKVPKI